MWMHALNNLNPCLPSQKPVKDFFFSPSLWGRRHQDVLLQLPASCGLCWVHLMYTDVAFKNSKDTGPVGEHFYSCFRKRAIPLIFKNAAEAVPGHSFMLPLSFLILFNSFLPKGTIALWSTSCVFLSFCLPHILMSGVWFCIFLLVNCLQVQYADTYSSTSVGKCNIWTYCTVQNQSCTVLK